jgi:hypothetical protein
VKDEDFSPRARGVLVVLAIAQTPLLVLWLGGMYAALAWRPAIYVALVSMTGRFLVHLVQGWLTYRAVMARPWPKVRPLDDDEDW